MRDVERQLTAMSGAHPSCAPLTMPSSFDVYNDDYQQMPPETVVSRARRAAEWLVETVLRRALPVPNMECLRRTAGD